MTKKKRYLWTQKHKHWTVKKWKRVLFSDERQFFIQEQAVKLVRRNAGEVFTDNLCNTLCAINQLITKSDTAIMR